MEVLPVLSSATMCSAWWYLLALCLCGLEVLLSLFSCFVLWTCDSWVPGIHEKWRWSLFSASQYSISVIVEDPDLMSNTGAPDDHLFCGVIWWQQRALSFLKIKVLSLLSCSVLCPNGSWMYWAHEECRWSLSSADLFCPGDQWGPCSLDEWNCFQYSTALCSVQMKKFTIK